MSIPAVDGAWVSATDVVKIECTKCGLVSISEYPMNERQQDEAIKDHLKNHGGRWWSKSGTS